MSEYSKSSEQLLFALLRYIQALEQGDIDMLSAVLQEASQNAVLAALLEELDDVYQDIDRTALSAPEVKQVLQRVLVIDQMHQQPDVFQNLSNHYDKKSQEGMFVEEQPTQVMPLIQSHTQPPLKNRAQLPGPPRKSARRLQLLAASLIVCVLVSSMIFVLHAVSPGRSTNSGHPAALTPTPSVLPTSTAFVRSTTSGNWGKIIDVRSTDRSFYGQEVAWSPDSQRVAALENNGAQIWDATTGAHPLTISLPTALPSANLLTWSPNGKWVAISDQAAIWIVDAQTGDILHEFSMESLLGSASTSSLLLPARLITQSSLSSLQARSGGLQPQISGMVWSADSNLLAVTTDQPSSPDLDRFEILNAQTGAVVHRFALQSTLRISVVGWSADGKYLAAKTDDDALDSSYHWTARVWNASTYNVVLQKDMGAGDNGGSMTWGPSLAWQGQTDNLAFARIEEQSSSNIVGVYPAIVLWDVAHNSQVHQYNLTSQGLFTISQDGTYLAVLSMTDQVVILDAQDGHQVYVYQPQVKGSVNPPNTKGYHTMQMSCFAWSPDSKYIALGSGVSSDPILIMGAE